MKELTSIQNQQFTSENSIWKSYRIFRSEISKVSQLEKQLGVDLIWLKELSLEEKVSLLEKEYLVQSLRALQEAYSNAKNEIQEIKNQIPYETLSNNSEFEKSLKRKIPNLDKKILGDILSTFSKYGSVLQWFHHVINYLSIKENTYSLCLDVIKGNKDIKNVFDIFQQIFVLQNKIAPKASVSFVERVTNKDKSKEEWDKKLDKANAKRMEQIKLGEPCFIANAEYKKLSIELSLKHPSIADELRISSCENPDPEAFLCLLGGMGLAMCILVFAISISSHNVE